MFLNWDYGVYFDSWFKRMDGKIDSMETTIDFMDDKIESELNLIESGVDLVQTSIDSAELNLDGRFDDIDTRIDGLEAKIDEIDTVVDERLDRTEWRLGRKLDCLDEHTGRRFKALEKKVQLHLDDTRALSRNALCTQGWQQVKPVSNPSNGNGLDIIPESLPDTVRSFWSLKKPSNSDTLTELLQYYQVQGYENWEQEEDAVVSIGPARLTGHAHLWPMLRSAVRSHPEIAHRALAMELGLDYDRIQANMENKSAVQQIGAAPTQSDESRVPEQDRKRRRVDATEFMEPERTTTARKSSELVARRTRRKITR
ncbi:MAG: hypothetical protein L6R42_007334 [Xanthoria sp. 1 TBL-2021]|nr:MAG: hypothetical protein L6R42_007334 [Xanthoria sp. 1 TBL-2021]